MRFLHAVITQDVLGLVPGQGAYGALVDDRGRPVSDFRLYVLPEAVLLEADAGTFDALKDGLERLVVADDVVLAEAEGTLACVEADDVAGALALLAPARRGHGWFVPPASALAGSTLAVGWNANVADAGEGLDDPAVLAALPRRLEAILLGARYGGVGLVDWSGPLAGGTPAGDIESRAIASGRFGAPELAEAKVWNELGAMQAVSFTKGCFMGQEILNRVESQGILQRRLVRLTVAGGATFGAAPLTDVDGNDAGVVTRSAHGHAFAFARRGSWEPGTRLFARPPGREPIPAEVRA